MATSTTMGVEALMGAGLDTGIPHAARIYNYVLGGKDNFQADRDAGDAMMAAGPLLAPSMRANRKFMTRVACHLAGLGFTQYLDIGTGLPLSPNLHETVQEVVPAADVVYVDNDHCKSGCAHAIFPGCAA